MVFPADVGSVLSCLPWQREEWEAAEGGERWATVDGGQTSWNNFIEMNIKIYMQY